MNDHSFVPVGDYDYECEFCGIDAYYDLDGKTGQYPSCAYSKLTTIPRVKRKQKPTSWLGKLIIAFNYKR